MEVIFKVDIESPEAKAFYQFSKTLPFVKVENEKRELSDEEVEKIAVELGREVNRSMTNRFLINRLKKRYQQNDSHNG